MTWAKVPAVDVKATWDSELLRFSDQNVYQSSPWGRYKSIRGWVPHHFRAASHGHVVGMLQALVRSYPLRTLIAWCPGGPVGTLEGCTRESMEQLASLLGARASYFRCTFARPRTPEDDLYLRQQGWTRPKQTLSANLTAVWDLKRTEDELLAGLNRNWRYSLRQAHKRGVLAEQLVDPPVHEMAELSTAMYASKGKSAAAHSSEIAALFAVLGDRAIVYGCRNGAGQLIAFHSCVMQGCRAWELVAATSPEGRRLGASFATLWALVRHCRNMNITEYDLAGLDPVNAPGVADFKRWTGARDVEWLGEWEWSTSSMLRRAVSLAIGTPSHAGAP